MTQRTDRSQRWGDNPIQIGRKLHLQNGAADKMPEVATVADGRRPQTSRKRLVDLLVTSRRLQVLNSHQPHISKAPTKVKL